ncbi:hypothetical protein [Pseudomarimonas salicorniae]|uniref:Uncharacterized protein n=1 Tax=Pseudomarimonas salicorniae TaxID=2933270 RepID=A0ABT0GCA1_9GAMM|nr:hypothetical protein [Lysobacter sp. CAU 1642]MCK7592164.1 hypothetical protein [Lysobacter sp. CAU 1642]
MPEPTRLLGEALRDLPTPPPPEDGWQRLHAALPEARPHRRHHWLAAAAVLLAAALGSLLLPAPPPSVVTGGPPPTEGDTTPASLAALRAESARWEGLLAGLATPVDSAASAVVEGAINDRIALIDLLLGDAAADSARHALWSERVLLLRDLYRLRQEPAPRLAGADRHSTAAYRML